MDKTFLIIILSIFSGYFFSYFYNKRELLENSLSDYLYYFALPSTIFLKIIDFDLKSIDLYIFVINTLPFVIMYVLVFFLYRFKIFTPSFSRTLMITSTFGNIVYLGFAVLSYNYSDFIIPIAAVSVAIQNIVIFTLGIFFINIVCYEKGCIIIGTKKAFINPIFISTTSGLLLNFIGFKISNIINEFLTQVSKTTIPLALFSIGVSIYGKNFNRSYIFKLITISIAKLLVLPFISIILIFIFKRFDIFSLVSFNLHTMPVALAAYVVAKDFELEKDVISGSIFLTTVLYFIFYWFYMTLNSKIFI